MTLNTGETRIVHVRHGFEFLGYKIKQGKRPLRLQAPKITSGVRGGTRYAVPRVKSIRHFKDQIRQETHEESQRRAQRDAREFSRLQSAAYNATGEERKAAQKEFDDYVERHSKTRETAEEEERQTHKRSRGRSMGM